MRKVFDKHKIPTSIRGYIYSFLSMRDEFNMVLHQIDTGVHMKLLFIGVVDTGYTDIYGFPKKVKQIESLEKILKHLVKLNIDNSTLNDNLKKITDKISQLNIEIGKIQIETI